MRLKKLMKVLSGVVVFTTCFMGGANAISQEYIDEIKESIQELQDKQATAQIMADSARKLGLEETSSPIEAAKEIWKGIDDEKMVLYKELEVAQRKLEEKKSRVYAGTFRLTGYCPCERCSGPWGYRTSSGARATEGITVAADPRVLPSGTRIYIEGVGERIVQDVGGAVKGNKIDVFVERHEHCYDANINGNANVYILR